jgi:hypothetical protein
MLHIEYTEKITDLPQVTDKPYHIMLHIEYTEKITDPPQVTDKLYHIVLYGVPINNHVHIPGTKY